MKTVFRIFLTAIIFTGSALTFAAGDHQHHDHKHTIENKQKEHHAKDDHAQHGNHFNPKEKHSNNHEGHDHTHKKSRNGSEGDKE